MVEPQDLVVRVLTSDGAFRLIVAMLTTTSQAVATRQRATGALAAELAELLVGTTLLREATQPDRRVQVVWRRGTRMLIADALGNRHHRGLLRPDAEPQARELLTVNTTQPSGRLHSGIVEVPTNAEPAVALQAYLRESEQLETLLQARCLLEGETISKVAGFLLQVMPGASPEAVTSFMRHMAALPDLATLLLASDDIETLTAQLVGHAPTQALMHAPLAFGCTCNQARILAGLLTMDDTAIAELLLDEQLEITCDACGTLYQLAASDLAHARSQARPN